MMAETEERGTIFFFFGGEGKKGKQSSGPDWAVRRVSQHAFPTRAINGNAEANELYGARVYSVCMCVELREEE